MKNQKESDYFLNIKTFLLICNAISIATNLILFVIFFLAEHQYKYFGIILHSLLIIFGINSIYFLFTKEHKNIYMKKYKLVTKYYSFLIYFSFLFYFAFLTYMYIFKYDIDIFYFLVFCIFLWGIFHLSLIALIKSFIREATKNNLQYGKMKSEKIKEIL